MCPRIRRFQLSSWSLSSTASLIRKAWWWRGTTRVCVRYRKAWLDTRTESLSLEILSSQANSVVCAHATLPLLLLNLFLRIQMRKQELFLQVFWPPAGKDLLINKLIRREARKRTCATSKSRCVGEFQRSCAFKALYLVKLWRSNLISARTMGLWYLFVPWEVSNI